MNRVLFTLVAAGAAASLTACDGLNYDVDQVALADASGLFDATEPVDTDPPVDMNAPVDADMSSDQGVPDTSMPRDMEPDVSRPEDVGADATLDVGNDAGDLGTPPSCEVEHPVEPERCNPLAEGECPSGGLCNIAFVQQGLRLICLQRSSEGPGMLGESCGAPSDCAEHLTCFNWSNYERDPRGQVCSKFCRIETGEGCTSDEFCTGSAALPLVEGYGWCTPRCDPYDSAACAEGQTCTIDYNFPADTCEPHFRCVRTRNAGAEGDACGAGAAVADCARGLSCYEVGDADYRCVKPCMDDVDCADTACGVAAGPWGLRYCQ